MRTSYGRTAVRGMIWVTIQAVFTKGMSLIAQLVLGWYLSKDDYAVYALAIGISGIVNAFRDGGLSRILIQRGREYDTLVGPIFQLSLGFNVICCALLYALSPWAVRFYDIAHLAIMLQVIGISILLSTPASILGARMQIQLKFRHFATVMSASAFLKYMSMIGFALAGFGPLSFVLPLVVTSVFEGVVFAVLVGLPRQFHRVTWSQATGLLHSTGWIVAAILATTLISSGDYLVIGRLQPDLLGFYAFGYQISVAFTLIFAAGLRSVLTPTFSHLADDEPRLCAALMRSIRAASILSGPIFVAASMVVPPCIDLLWQQKWNPSAPVAQIMLASLLFRILTPIAISVMTARGYWRLQAFVLGLDGIGTLVAAVIGCGLGSLESIAIAVAVNRALMAVIQCSVAAHYVGSDTSAVLNAILPAVILSAVCAGASVALLAWWPEGTSLWLKSGLMACIFVMLFLLAAFRFQHRELALLRTELHGALRRFSVKSPSAEQSPDNNAGVPFV